LDKELDPIESKYAKYSTEQLEVILLHLTDSDDQELVKKELGKRYYHHYLSIIKNPDERPQDVASAAQGSPSPVPDDSEEDIQATDPTGQLLFQDQNKVQPEETLPSDDDLVGIPEVAPIILPPPESEKTAAAIAEQNGSAKEAKRKFCFVATAAYGSPLAREVVLLKTFRDNHLSQNFIGEKFIRAYYCVSPYFARQISDNKFLKLLTRRLLAPIIFLIKKNFGEPGGS
jgi:hypothetical protein